MCLNEQRTLVENDETKDILTMIFDLTDIDIKRILLIHHLIVIGLTIAVSILWAKVSIMKKELKKQKDKKA